MAIITTNFHLNSHFAGNPSPKIRWLIKEESDNPMRQRLNIRPVDTNLIKEINKSTNRTLTIKLTRSFYGQILSCEAENESNKLQHTIIIDLNRKFVYI